MKMINMSGDSTLKDLSLKVAYSSEDANILDEFYMLTLSRILPVLCLYLASLLISISGYLQATPSVLLRPSTPH